MNPKTLVAFAASAALAVTVARAADTTITFENATWTDRVGNTHAVQNTNYDFWDYDDTSPDDHLGNAATDAAGTVSFTTNDDDVGSEIEFYAYLRAAVPSVTHVKANITDAEPYLWLTPSSGTLDIAEGSSGTYAGPAVTNADNIGTAIGVVQAIAFIANYYDNTHAAALPFVPVEYNSSITKSAYVFGGPNAPYIRLRYGAWGAWDVVMHEYAHHIAHVKGFQNSPGGNHNVGASSIGPLDQGVFAQDGARLAWGEGVATHLGLMAVHHGNLAAAIPGLPAQDYNSNYDNYQSTGSVTDETHLDFRYSVENRTSSFGGTPQGEGDEWSVGLVLWDLYDSGASNGNAGNENYAAGVNRNDQASWGATKLYKMLDDNDPTTFRDLWHLAAAAAMADPSLVGLPAGSNKHLVLGTLGEILEEARIACVPDTAGTVFDDTPTLRFFERNADRSGDYALVLFDSSYNLLTSARWDNALATANQYVWEIDVALTAGEQYWWGALNTSALYGGVDPSLLTNIDKWYWSGLNPITYQLVPEPAALGVLAAATVLVFRRRR